MASERELSDESIAERYRLALRTLDAASISDLRVSDLVFLKSHLKRYWKRNWYELNPPGLYRDQTLAIVERLEQLVAKVQR